MKTRKAVAEKATKKTATCAKKAVAKKTCAKACAKTEKAASKKVTFVLRAEAGHDIRLAGTFTEWATKAEKMSYCKKDGAYTVAVDLLPGSYEYKFIVDGVWTTDEQNMNAVKNPMGTFNSVIDVK